MRRYEIVTFRTHAQPPIIARVPAAAKPTFFEHNGGCFWKPGRFFAVAWRSSCKQVDRVWSRAGTLFTVLCFRFHPSISNQNWILAPAASC